MPDRPDTEPLPRCQECDRIAPHRCTCCWVWWCSPCYFAHLWEREERILEGR